MSSWHARLPLNANIAKAIDDQFLWLDEMEFSAFPNLAIFEEDDDPSLWRLDVYLPFAPDSDEAQNLFTALAEHSAIHLAPDHFVELPDQDWVSISQHILAPIMAGKFVAFGAHDAGNVPDHLIHLQVEAGQAFGTGGHATTQGCLQAISLLADRPMTRTPKVLDVGTGSGILAMAAWHIWKGPVLATDNDPIATQTAAITFKTNDIPARIIGADASGVALATAEGFASDAIIDEAPFDLIIANILAQPLIDMAADLVKHLAPEGRVILSGLLQSQEADVIAAYARCGMVVEQSFPIEDWQALLMKRA